MRSAPFIAALFLAAAPLQAGQEPAESIRFFKEARPLRVDESRIAVYRADSRAPHAEHPLAALGVAPDDARPHPVNGWTLVDAQPVAGRAGAAAPRALVARAALENDIDFVSPVFIDDLAGPMIVTRRIIAGFDPGAPRAMADEAAALTRAGRIVQRDWAGMKGVVLIESDSRSGFDVLDAANALADLHGVLFAEPDMIFTGRTALIPNDPGFSNCWGIRNTGQFGGAPGQDMKGAEAWDITIGSPDIKVVIIDTGVQQDHPDLNQVPGADFTSDGGNGGPVNAFDNHGTPVAGCVSAIINNNLGTVGIAPGTRSASARTFITINAQGNWNSSASWTVNALAWAETIGARVTNNSNQYGFTSSAINLKYQQTRAAGIIHFGSAGNNGLPEFITYPASLPDVMAVAALAPSGLPASFTNGGMGLFIAAPGTSVYSTDRTGAEGYGGGDYVFVQGTSFASPYTAGVAALVLSFNPLLSATDVESILASTAVDKGAPGFDPVYGWGFVNARNALLATPPPGPPSSFGLISPAQGAVNVPRLPSFQWESATAAVSYIIIIDDDPAFTSPLFEGTVNGASFTYPGPALPHSSTFHWRVTAMNTAGSTLATPASSSFTTISDPPGAFALTSPADGATGVSLMPSFQWGAAPLAEGYTITIDNDADFSSPIVVFNTLLTVYNQPSPLPGNTTLYWKVSANNAVGSTPSTPDARSFTTLQAIPGAFALLTPADGANVSTRTPTLNWGASSGADSYRVIIDDDLSLTSPVVDQQGVPGTSFTVPQGLLLNQTRYYWRVIAGNGSGSTTGSPATASFGVVVPFCMGDANGDGVVTFPDITAVLNNWGGPGPMGDANNDGQVNFIDISTILQAWGAVCP